MSERVSTMAGYASLTRPTLPRVRLGSTVGADEVADLGIDLRLPPPAVEDPVMADIELQVAGLLRFRHVTAETLRCCRLADGANVVSFALDGHQRGLLDRARIDQFVVYAEPAMRQILALKHPVNGLQIEIGRQVHHRAVFVVEGAGRRRLVDIASH